MKTRDARQPNVPAFSFRWMEPDSGAPSPSSLAALPESSLARELRLRRTAPSGPTPPLPRRTSLPGAVHSPSASRPESSFAAFHTIHIPTHTRTHKTRQQ